MISGPHAGQLDDWIAAKLDGQLTPEEFEAFTVYLAAHPDAQLALRRAQDTHTKVIYAFESVRPDASMDARLLHRFREDVKPRRKFTFFAGTPTPMARALSFILPALIILLIVVLLSDTVLFKPVQSYDAFVKSGAETYEANPSALSAEPAFKPKSVETTHLFAVEGVRDAKVRLAANDWDATSLAIQTEAERRQGFIVSSEWQKRPTGEKYGTQVAKLPPAELDPFLQSLSSLGDVLAQSIVAREITPDRTARLRNAGVIEEGLLARVRTGGATLSELLKLELELARVRQTLEQIEAEATFAVVSITLLEGRKPKASPPVENAGTPFTIIANLFPWALAVWILIWALTRKKANAFRGEGER